MFQNGKPIIGMVHLAPLPGSARFSGELDVVINAAIADALTLERGGVDGIMVENFFDAPFCKSDVPPITVASMTSAVLAIRNAVKLPLGVNVLRNDVRAAISIAHACKAQFVRCNVYVGASVTDQGIIEGAARQAVMTRQHLNAKVEIWADVDVKHASSIGDQSPGELAADAVERGLADAVIVTGSSTGQEASLETVVGVKRAVPNSRVIVGSGINHTNIQRFLEAADAVIVGSSLKARVSPGVPVDLDMVLKLVAAAKGAH